MISNELAKRSAGKMYKTIESPLLQPIGAFVYHISDSMPIEDNILDITSHILFILEDYEYYWEIEVKLLNKGKIKYFRFGPEIDELSDYADYMYRMCNTWLNLFRKHEFEDAACELRCYGQGYFMDLKSHEAIVRNKDKYDALVEYVESEDPGERMKLVNKIWGSKDKRTRDALANYATLNGLSVEEEDE